MSKSKLNQAIEVFFLRMFFDSRLGLQNASIEQDAKDDVAQENVEIACFSQIRFKYNFLFNKLVVLIEFPPIAKVSFANDGTIFPIE